MQVEIILSQRENYAWNQTTVLPTSTTETDIKYKPNVYG